MGFTHYWDYLELSKYPEGLIDVFNQAYQDFLRSWVTIEGKHLNLFSTFFKMNEDEDLFNEHFHEYTTWASWEPLLFSNDGEDWNFCKTARKSYDVAVVLTLFLASIVLNKEYNSDGDVIHTFDWLKIYIERELDDSMIYNIEQLEFLFNLWLNKCIIFFEEIQEVEDNKKVDRICDLSDLDLEYIAEQVKLGVSCIYLNNWQVVRISFE